MDGISCSSGKAKIAVFRNIHPFDVFIKAPHNKAFNLVGDEYKIENCTPINFNGENAVACEGHKTTLIYTPNRETRPFDELDGRLMLGRLAILYAHKFWTFVKKATGRTEYQDYNPLIIVSEEDVLSWENDIEQIGNILHQEGIIKDELIWAEDKLEKIVEMVNHVKGNDSRVGVETLEEIYDRLTALQEDVSEQILFTSAEKTFDFYQDDVPTRSGRGFMSSNTNPNLYTKMQSFVSGKVLGEIGQRQATYS